jgi:hypothetical protein
MLSPAQHELIDRSAHITAKADPAYLNELTKFFGEGFVDTEHTGNADYVVASEGYFQSLGIPLRRQVVQPVRTGRVRLMSRRSAY